MTSAGHPMALGLESLGGQDWGEFDLLTHQKAIDQAWDLGLRYFDTAAAYGLGLSESRLADHLGARRFEAQIVTKGGLEWDEPVVGRAKVRKNNGLFALKKSIEGSLRRLKIESLPVFLVHWPDGQTPVEDIYEGLRKFKKEGLIRAFGFSNFSHEDWQKILVKKADGEVLHCEMSLNMMSARRDRELLKNLRDQQVQVFTYGALAQGLFSGKYDRSTVFLETDRRHRLPQFQSAAIFETFIPELRVLAVELSLEPATIALRWLLSEGLSNWVVVGCKNPSQVVRNYEALKMPLSESAYERLNKILEKIRD